MVIALSVLFLSSSPPRLGPRAPAPGLARRSRRSRSAPGSELVGPSYQHAMEGHGHRIRWLLYLLAGVAAAIAIGPYLVLVLVACGLLEMIRAAGARAPRR